MSSLLRDIAGVCATLSRVHVRAHLSTLRHFDHNVALPVKKRPLIPCERRLLKSEI